MSTRLRRWFRNLFKGDSSSDEPSPLTGLRQASLEELQERMAYRFRDVILLHNALTHSSFANENPALAGGDNERLEFLGDAVLQLCISDMLVRRFPEVTEGDLSKFRTSLVSEQPLTVLAKRIQLGDHLMLGRGEENSGGRMKNSLLANAFEAVMGAVFLDGGYKRALELTEVLFRPLLDTEDHDAIYRDFKSALQEAAYNRYGEAPRYTIIAERGPDHNKTYTVGITIAGSVTATGTGKSKREAEQQAAKRALEALSAEAGGDPERDDPWEPGI